VRREGIRKESERDTVVVVLLLEGLYIMLRRKRKAS